MGNNFQFIDIIFFAMVAAFLVLRLRSVLGRRDGHERDFRNPFKPRNKEQNKEQNKEKTSENPDDATPDDNVIPLSGRDDPDSDDAGEKERSPEPPDDDDPLAQGLFKVRSADPSFNAEEFISGARIAFEVIVGAYAAGDAAALKPLLNAEVYANFSQAIRDREQAGETLEDTLVGITSAEIVEAYVDDGTLSITAKFVSEQINATRDENGDVIDGNPNAVIDVTDFWTFARDVKSNDPNWDLVATSSLE